MSLGMFYLSRNNRNRMGHFRFWSMLEILIYYTKIHTLTQNVTIISHYYGSRCRSKYL